MKESHITQFRIYYEDTDAGGVVYHTNYLKFAERARTEWLRGKGFEQGALLKEEDSGFAVVHLECEFKAPARLDDMIAVETCLQEASKVRMRLRQIIKRGTTLLAHLTVTVAWVKKGRPAKLPELLLNKRK